MVEDVLDGERRLGLIERVSVGESLQPVSIDLFESVGGAS